MWLVPRGSRDKLPQRRSTGWRLDGMALSDEAVAGQDHEGANYLAGCQRPCAATSSTALA
jgi:hypothetical protein